MLAAAAAADAIGQARSRRGRAIGLRCRSLRAAAPWVLFLDRDVEIALAAQDANRDFVVMPGQVEINARVANAEVEDSQLGQAGWKRRPVENQAASEPVDGESQACLQQQEDRGGRPGLGRAGDGVGDRADTGLALEPAEQLGHPVQVEIQSGFKEASEQPRGGPGFAVARETPGDQCVVVGPDRPVMVRKRIVRRFPFGEGANSPAGEQLGVQDGLGDPLAAEGAGDSGEQAMTGVGGSDAARPLGPVQGQRIGAQVFTPE